ncbi:MAG: MOSC domain-containing protein [Myxococcota bacterium]|nr:MOSC domain-containing protein [Myxococcota bacterium]
MIRLSQIHAYPLKSAGGVDCTQADIGARGIIGDRRWMVVTPDGAFLTGRTLPGMVRLQARVVGDDLVLTLGSERCVVSTPTLSEPRMTVTVWGDAVSALVATDGGWLAARLGVACRLVYMDDTLRRPVDPDYALSDDITSFADGFPALLISEASLADLNSRLREPVTMAHFRPNLVASGCAAFAEDGWQQIRIGTAEFALVKPCSRCIFTTVDPQTGALTPDGEPLATLARYRRSAGGVMFGQNLLVTRPGHVGINDTITVLR